MVLFGLVWFGSFLFFPFLSFGGVAIQIGVVVVITAAVSLI